jgi:hypothetical protein
VLTSIPRDASEVQETKFHLVLPNEQTIKCQKLVKCGRLNFLVCDGIKENLLSVAQFMKETGCNIWTTPTGLYIMEPGFQLGQKVTQDQVELFVPIDEDGLFKVNRAELLAVFGKQ